MKTGISRIVSIALALVLLFGIIPLGTAAAENSLITGKFTYMPSFVDEAATDSYYYSDDYFSDPAEQSNQHLLSMSAALALSSMEIGGDSYVTALYKDIGYTDIKTEDMTTTPTKDTIGTAIAHKKIDGFDVIAVSVRGNKYGAEWASNLTAGESGDIYGFSSAGEKVISRIKDYIAEYDLSKVKLWIAGYSRAGSVADLAGVYINEHLDEFNTTADDMYVYCFEAPRCCVSDKVYDNIFCVRNKNDVITYVYPESWGLYTNGADIVIGDELTVNKVKIDLLESEKVVVLGDMPMDEFNKEFISFISDELTREKFSGEFDGAIAELLEMYFGKSSEEWSGVTEFFKNSDFLSNAMDNGRFLYIMMDEAMSGVMLHNSDAMYRQFTDELLLLFDEMGITADALGMTQEEYKTICDDLYPLLRALGPLFVKDYKYKDGIDYSEALPEDYDDPEYDPQTAEYPILTYDQYMYQQENQPEEPEEPLSDAAQGEDDGRSDGYDRGYADGLVGNEPLTEAPLPKDAESRSQEYLDAYRNGYMSSYEDAYQWGTKELSGPEYSEDYYRGDSDADDQVAADAKKDALTQSYRASYNEEPVSQEDGAPYSEDYLEGYHSRYRLQYDGYYRTYTDYYKELTLYHLATLFVNREAILTQHYPQTNWAMIKAMDSYYTSGAPEEDKSETATEELDKEQTGEPTKEPTEPAASVSEASSTKSTAAVSVSSGVISTGSSATALLFVLCLLSATAILGLYRKKKRK